MKDTKLNNFDKEIERESQQTENEKRKSKWKLITGVTCLLVFSCAFIGYVIMDNEQKKMDQVFNNGMAFSFYTDKVETIEYGSPKTAKSFVKEFKGKLKHTNLNTKKLGKQVIRYSLQYGDYTQNFEKIVYIKDSVKPKIIPQKGTTFEIFQDEEIPYSTKDFIGEDPVDGKLSVSLKGMLNTHKLGKYTQIAHCKDKNGNVSEIKIETEVKPIETTPKYSYSIGSRLDDFQKIDNQTYIVRGRTMFNKQNAPQEVVDSYIHQINLSPDFLIESVDKFVIADSNEIKEELKKQNVSPTCYQNFALTSSAGIVHAIIPNTKENKNIILKSCIQGFENKNHMIQKIHFQEAYKKEKNNFDSDLDINDFFNQTFLQYLTEGYNTLYKKCPITANIFRGYQL